MTSIRRLEGRLKAWRSFRELAHAARSLAAAQSLRGAARVEEATRHLGRCRALAAAWPSPPPREGFCVLIGIGTDLGLCGRLNRLVADALAARAATIRRERGRPPLTITVGQRLRIELGERLAGAPEMPTPTSSAAALALAGQLERLLVAVAPATAIDLELVLAGATLPSGAPVIVTWDGRESAEGGDLAAAEAGAGDRDRDPGGAAPNGPRGAPGPASRPSHRKRGGAHVPVAATLSPPERVWEPAAGLVLHARLVHALAAAAASEADARLQTMSRAVDTSDRRIDEHERLLRKHRQESTTQEMLEVLGGRRGALGARAP